MTTVFYRICLVVLLMTGAVFAGCATSNKVTSNLEQLQLRAEQGDQAAQYELGKAYCCGLGLRRNTRKALYWHCRAAIQGHAPAQYELGNILSNFQNDPDRNVAFAAADYTSAYMWYTVASINGHRNALDARENIAAQMSGEDVLRAKRWATKWTQIHCDNVR